MVVKFTFIPDKKQIKEQSNTYNINKIIYGEIKMLNNEEKEKFFRDWSNISRRIRLLDGNLAGLVCRCHLYSGEELEPFISDIKDELKEISTLIENHFDTALED